MPIDRPFHRNYRGMKQGHPNAGYSGWAYLIDRDYAKSPDHYIRAFDLIQSDLQDLFQYIEPSPESSKTYSYKIHGLLMRTCIEVEANFKAILSENKYTPKLVNGKPKLDMSIYQKVNTTHHLSSYEVLLPIWNGPRKIWKPFDAWNSGGSLPWYQAYNASKHDRQEEFKKANLEHLVDAVAGLLVLLSSQFQTQNFSAGEVVLVASGYDYHEMEASIGSLFRIKFPEDWQDHEIYEFNWSDIASRGDRFQKIDYDAIP